MSPQGEGLTHFFTQDSIANRINKTINWIRNNACKPFDIDMLAEMAHMTRSTYYRHFKTITKLSPTAVPARRQCLYQAQHLMLTKGYSAAQAAFEVGCASPISSAANTSAPSACRRASTSPNSPSRLRRSGSPDSSNLPQIVKWGRSRELLPLFLRLPCSALPRSTRERRNAYGPRSAFRSRQEPGQSRGRPRLQFRPR